MPRSFHDTPYKRFFSHREMVADLLDGFLDRDLVCELDLSTLEPVKASFVTDDFREREDDIIWRVRWQGRWFYIYILLEFQSTVDPFMALRVMIYIGLLYQDLIRNKQLTEDRLLPPVLPIVLYNGQPKWTAPLSVSELILPVVGMEQWRPECRYHLLSERDYSDAELALLRNLVAALFRLEKSRTKEDVVRVLRLLVELLKEPGREELRRTFTAWVRQILLPRRLPEAKVEAAAELEEMTTMLAERVEEWTRVWRKEGEAAIILRQMEKRFGPLTDEQRERVAQADDETLLRWGDNVLTAGSLEDVFE